MQFNLNYKLYLNEENFLKINTNLGKDGCFLIKLFFKICFSYTIRFPLNNNA